MVLPANKSQDVSFISSDENVIKVNDFGSVKAISDGVARVIVKSKEYEYVTNEITFIVMTEDEIYYEDIIENIIKNQEISVNTSDYRQIFEGIINYNSSSLIGVSSYKYQFNKLVSSVFGAGIIYKMNIHYLDGTVKENATFLDNSQDIKEFTYYVITDFIISEITE